jgi:PEP-CTERM motif
MFLLDSPSADKVETSALNLSTQETKMAHRKVHLLAGVSALVLCLAWASPVAHATLTISSAVGGAPAGVSLQNFNSLTAGPTNGAPLVGTNNGAILNPTNAGSPPGAATLTVTFNPTNGTLPVGVASGTSGTNAAPVLSGSNGNGFGSPNQPNGTDTTAYLTTGTGSVTMTFSSNQMYFGLLWGSVDTYNTLTFYENGVAIGGGGDGVSFLTGTDVLGSGADGNQGAGGTAYVNITSTLAFNEVVATSSINAFEFDNVAYNPTPIGVPEPSTFVVAAFGAMGMIGFGLRRKALKFKS